MNIEIQDHGSIVLFIPLDTAAREWLEDNCAAEPWQWLNGALAVDHRLAGVLVEAVQP